MALQELKAMQVAYELLSPLDPNAQQRVMAWLSGALADPNGAPTAVDEPAAPVETIAEVPAETAREDSVAKVVAERAMAVPQVQTAAPTTPDVDPVAAAESEVTLESVAEPTPAPRLQRNRSATTTGRRAAKAANPAPAGTRAQETQGRQGDRPGGEQFLADLTAAGSFKALAQKYGKSIGTIGNWANQLREQGFDIPGGRQKKA